jgi:hypothetical protein
MSAFHSLLQYTFHYPALQKHEVDSQYSMSCHSQLPWCISHWTLQDGRTPLYEASLGGHKDVAQLLLDCGAGVNIASKARMSSIAGAF